MAWFRAGTKFIDTGYNDPVAWDRNYAVAEIYGARVYYAGGGSNSSGLDPGQWAGNWKIEAVPLWATDVYHLVAPPGVANNNRIFIRCDFYLFDPQGSLVGGYRYCDAVYWALYRI